MKPATAAELSRGKQVWASFETQGRLLKMDVEKAKAEYEIAKSNYNMVRELVKRDATTGRELADEHLKAKIVEFALSRTTEILIQLRSS